MCDPISIAGAVLTAGSVVANNRAAGSVERARNDALAAERIRQGGLNQEADAINARSRERYEGFQDREAQTQQDLAAFLRQRAEPPEGAAQQVMPQSSSNITVSEEGRQRDRAQAFTDQSAENLARLRSFGDLLGGIGRDQSRDAGQVAQIGGFKQGWSSGVLPLEMAAANQRGGRTRMLADVLGGLGSVATTAGAGGAWDGLGIGGGASAAPVSPASFGGGLRLPSLYGAS